MTALIYDCIYKPASLLKPKFSPASKSIRLVELLTAVFEHNQFNALNSYHISDAAVNVSPNTSPSFVAERRSRRMQASRDNLHNILHIATNALENGLDFAAIDDIIEEAGQAADDDDDDNYNNHFGNDNSIDDYGDRSLQ